MATLKIRFLQERSNKDGTRRYLWVPSSELRKLGWRALALTAEGKPSPRFTAIAQAEWCNALLDAWRKADTRRIDSILDVWLAGEAFDDLAPCPAVEINIPGQNRRAMATPKKKRNFDELVLLFLKSPDFKLKRRQTRQDYRSQFRILSQVIGNIPVAEIGTAMAMKLHQEYFELVSLHTANARMRHLSLLLTFARKMEWISHNPLHNMGWPSSPGRIRIWTEEEEEALIMVADWMDRPSIGDLVKLGAICGQRLGDLTRLPLQADGRVRIRQSKTGANIDVKMIPSLRSRMEQARIRNRSRHGDLAASFAQAKLKHPQRWKRYPGPAILINETTGLPYLRDTASHDFAAIRQVAGELCPSLASARLQDLRDTAVTRLHEAGCNLFEIIAISGHSYQSADMILKHYLALKSKTADAAMDKLAAAEDAKEGGEKG